MQVSSRENISKLQNDMRKGGTARTDETRSLCLFNKVGFTKQKRKEIYRL